MKQRPCKRQHVLSSRAAPAASAASQCACRHMRCTRCQHLPHGNTCLAIWRRITLRAHEVSVQMDSSCQVFRKFLHQIPLAT